MDYKIQHNNAEDRFEALGFDDTVIGLVDYCISEDGKTLIVPHTEVNKEYEGNGIAGALTKALLDYARLNSYKIMPVCPYTKTYIERHPDYSDLI